MGCAPYKVPSTGPKPVIDLGYCVPLRDRVTNNTATTESGDDTKGSTIPTSKTKRKNQVKTKVKKPKGVRKKSMNRPDSEQIAPDSEPAAPDSASTAPDSEPTAPDSAPTAPDSAPTAPDSEPTAPDSEPAAPDSEPTAPDSEPTAPDSEPTAPDSEPTAPDLNQIATDSQELEAQVTDFMSKIPLNSKEEPTAPISKAKRKKRVKTKRKKRVKTKGKKPKRVRKKKTNRPDSTPTAPDLEQTVPDSKQTPGSDEITMELNRVDLDTKDWIAKDQARHKQQVRANLWSDSEESSK